MAISSGFGPHAAWLTVNGQALPIEHGEVSSRATRRSASFSCVVPMAWPGAAAALARLGDNVATITVMTRGSWATLLTGEIDETEFDEIHRTIHITGRDKSAKLHDTKTSEKWLNKTPSEIIQELIGRVGLGGTVTGLGTLAGKQLSQDFVKLANSLSLATVIHRLAEFEGARWWVDGNGTFHYVPYGSPQGTYSITINQQSEPISADCLDLRIRRNVQAGKPLAVTVKGWHPRKKQVVSHTSNVSGTGTTRSYNYEIPTLVQGNARQHARSRATERARQEFCVTATVVGDPTVVAGMGLQLNGTQYFDQTYDLDEVHHDFGMGGHLTHLVARAPKSGRTAS